MFTTRSFGALLGVAIALAVGPGAATALGAGPTIAGSPGRWELGSSPPVRFRVENVSADKRFHVNSLHIVTDVPGSKAVRPLNIYRTRPDGRTAAESPACTQSSTGELDCTNLDAAVGDALTVDLTTDPNPYPEDGRITVWADTSTPGGEVAGAPIVLVAPNDFGPNGTTVPPSAYDAGSRQRADPRYLAANPDPALRSYYELGGRGASGDSPCRARLAYRAALYEAPVNGYETHVSTYTTPRGKIHSDGPRPRPGGGRYAHAMPTDPATIVEHVYKYVQDLTYPKFFPQNLKSDVEICRRVALGHVDIGKPLAAGDHPTEGFACIETNVFFTSLIRELGFPAREADILPFTDDPSTHTRNYDIQTAASQVWFDGAWHFFDPWESFRSPADYVKGPNGDAGFSGGTAVEMWVRDAPLTDFGSDYGMNLSVPEGENPLKIPDGWKKVEEDVKNGERIEVKTFGLRLRVEDSGGRFAGWHAAGAHRRIPGSGYIGHDQVSVDGNTALAPPAGAFGREVVTLAYPAHPAPGRHAYRLLLSNPTRHRARFRLRIDSQSATTAMAASPRTLRGVVPAGATTVERVVVTIGGGGAGAIGPACVAGSYSSPPLTISTPGGADVANYHFETPIPNSAYYAHRHGYRVGGCQDTPVPASFDAAPLLHTDIEVHAGDGGLVAWRYDDPPYPSTGPSGGPISVHSGAGCDEVRTTADGTPYVVHDCFIQAPNLGFPFPHEDFFFTGQYDWDATNYPTYAIDVAIQNRDGDRPGGGDTAPIYVTVRWRPVASGAP